MHEEAVQQNFYAEVYANAVSLLGVKAAEEIQARDFENFQLKQFCENLYFQSIFITKKNKENPFKTI